MVIDSSMNPLEQRRSNARNATTIVDVRGRALRVAIAEPVRLSFGTLDHRFVVLIEIELANGVIGIGESWVNWPAWAAYERLVAYEHGLRSRLLGRDAGCISLLRQELVAELQPGARQAGALGPLLQAISGVDLALWDALGKTKGMSVAGVHGQIRDSVPVYASSIGPGPDLDRSCEYVIEAGFIALKLRVGFGRDTDRDVIRRVRRNVGGNFDIIADANRAWTLEEAIQTGRMLADHGIELVEEPLTRSDLKSLEQFHSETGLGVAVGENLYDSSQFAAVLGLEGIGAIQPDVTKCGGFSLAHQVAEMAASSGVAVMPHCYGGPLGFLASLHLMATMDVEGSVEYPFGPSVPFWKMIGSPPQIRDGRVDVPTGSGFGFRPDRDWISAATVAQIPSGSG
ncbi:MAG: mandelate racemase/muconate lactonizing enzyme family protein [Acidimicrobiales bacterium]